MRDIDVRSTALSAPRNPSSPTLTSYLNQAGDDPLEIFLGIMACSCITYIPIVYNARVQR